MRSVIKPGKLSKDLSAYTPLYSLLAKQELKRLRSHTLTGAGVKHVQGVIVVLVGFTFKGE